MRWFALAGLWVLLFVAAMHWQTMRREPVVTAARPLPANHLIFTGDVQVAGMTGRYVSSKVEKGEALSARDVAPRPQIPPRVTLVSYLVEVARVRDGTVDADKSARFCNGATQLGDELKVMAVLCDGAANESCTVLLATVGNPPGSQARVPGPNERLVVGTTCK